MTEEQRERIAGQIIRQIVKDASMVDICSIMNFGVAEVESWTDGDYDAILNLVLTANIMPFWKERL